MRGRVTLFVCCLAALALMPFVGASARARQRRAAPALRVRWYVGSAGTLPRAVHRGRQGDHEPALHELPSGERPSDPGQRHAPASAPVTRGADGGGVPGNTCGACHMDRSVPIFAGQQTTFQSMPGHPRWGLAPIEMAWEGKSAGRSAARSRTRSATAGAISHCCTSIWRTTISWAGPGSRGPVAIPCPAPRSGWASWLRRGSTAAPRVRSALELLKTWGLLREVLAATFFWPLPVDFSAGDPPAAPSHRWTRLSHGAASESLTSSELLRPRAAPTIC